jgi:hypothetical protein
LPVTASKIRTQKNTKQARSGNIFELHRFPL